MSESPASGAEIHFDKRVTADQAVALIDSGDTLATAGFVGVGFPELLACALEARFLATQTPAALTLVFDPCRPAHLCRSPSRWRTTQPLYQ